MTRFCRRHLNSKGKAEVLITMLEIEIVAVINWSGRRAWLAPVLRGSVGRAGSHPAARPTNARMRTGVVDRTRVVPTRRPRRNLRIEATIIHERLAVISISCRRDLLSKMQIKPTAEQRPISCRMPVPEVKPVKTLNSLTSKSDRSSTNHKSSNRPIITECC